MNRTTIGWIAAGLYAAYVSLSMIGKLAKGEESMALLQRQDLESWITILGLGQLLCLVLFLIPRTAVLGTLLLSAYWGGAIVFHMISKDSFILPSALMIIAWAILFIRKPSLIS